MRLQLHMPTVPDWAGLGTTKSASFSGFTGIAVRLCLVVLSMLSHCFCFAGAGGGAEVGAKCSETFVAPRASPLLAFPSAFGCACKQPRAHFSGCCLRRWQLVYADHTKPCRID